MSRAPSVSILAAFGRDCAGAIMVLPHGDRPGGNDRSGYSPMTPDDLQRVISALDVIPLAAAPERGFRPSLAGRLGAARYVRVGTVARLARMKFPESHDGDVALAVAATRAIASPAYSVDEQEVRRMVERDQVSGIRDTAAQSRQAGAKWHGGRLSQLRVPPGPARRAGSAAAPGRCAAHRRGDQWCPARHLARGRALPACRGVPAGSRRAAGGLTVVLRAGSTFGQLIA